MDVYFIEDKVGQGSYGIVYKAFKRKDPEKFYAIKCVNKQKVGVKRSTSRGKTRSSS